MTSEATDVSVLSTLFLKPSIMWLSESILNNCYCYVFPACNSEYSHVQGSCSPSCHQQTKEVVTFCTERIWWIMKCRFSVCLFLIFKLEDVGRTGDPVTQQQRDLCCQLKEVKRSFVGVVFLSFQLMPLIIP